MRRAGRRLRRLRLVAELEPTVPLPDAGPGLPESRFVVADVLAPLRPRRAASPRCCAAIPTRSRRSSRPTSTRPPRELAARRSATLRASPTRRRTRPGVAPLQGVHPRAATRSRSSSRSAPSGRRRRPALALYRALRRVNPSPYLFLLELGELALVGSSPETHVKLRGHARDRSTRSRARRGRATGDAERLLALREGPRRARDARRPRPQRPLARLPAGHGARRALPRGRSASRTSRTSSRRSRASCATASAPFDLLRATFPAGTVSGAPKVRAMQIISELEGYRRGLLRGRRRLPLPGGRARHVHRDPHAAPARRASRYLQAGGGIVADSDPAAEHEECLHKLAARRARDRAGGGRA